MTYGITLEKPAEYGLTDEEQKLSDDVRDLDSVRGFVLCASRLDRHAENGS